jgi:hypothetical protein
MSYFSQKKRLISETDGMMSHLPSSFSSFLAITAGDAPTVLYL